MSIVGAAFVFPAKAGIRDTSDIAGVPHPGRGRFLTWPFTQPLCLLKRMFSPAYQGNARSERIREEGAFVTRGWAGWKPAPTDACNLGGSRNDAKNHHRLSGESRNPERLLRSSVILGEGSGFQPPLERRGGDGIYPKLCTHQENLDDYFLILRLTDLLYRPPYMGLKKLWRKLRPWAQEWQRRSTGSGMASPDLWVMRNVS